MWTMPTEDGAEIGTPVSIRGREFVFVRDHYKWVSKKGVTNLAESVTC